MSGDSPIRTYVLDDEPLGVKRMRRLLSNVQDVEIIGSATDPVAAVNEISETRPELLFLDIQMPGLNGFEVLKRLPYLPVVIFTTAYDEYALEAFEVNSIDYLLKPVEQNQLERALSKFERLRSSLPHPDLPALVERLAADLAAVHLGYPARIASRVGERTQLIDLNGVTHFLAEDRLTYAVTGEKRYLIDQSIAELERRLDPRCFVRIHRSTLLNTNYIDEIHQWFAGRALVRLKDAKRTELLVARDRLRHLRKHIEL